MPKDELPTGVIYRPLVMHRDERGQLSELYRQTWTTTSAFLQWNIVRSEANVLRGVHVHPRHSDYLHVIEGELVLGLHDLRPDDPHERTSTFLTLSGSEPSAVYIPPGVCHGFYFPQPTLYIYGLSTGWSMDEEIGCSYDDPGLGLNWRVDGPLLSPRDAAPVHDYASMRATWVSTATVSA